MFFFKRKRKDYPSNTISVCSLTENNGPQGELRPEKKPTDNIFFSGSVASDVGCVRGNNEDNYILGTHLNADSSDHSECSVSAPDRSGHWHFAGVFDGMGGGEQGELASLQTAQVFLNASSGLNERSTKLDVEKILRNAFLEANNRIVTLQKECNIFGTTGTVLCANNVEFKIFHLGDSRAYLIRGGHLFQLTKDQTLAQIKMDAGLYDEAAPQAEADKHKLTEYIGRDWTQKNLHPVESEWICIQKADRLLLCSDGLYDMCSDTEMEKTLQRCGDTQEQVKRLVETARRNGGLDNITCLIAAFS